MDIPASFVQKKNSFFAASAPEEGRRAHRGVTIGKYPPNLQMRHQPANRLPSPSIFRALPYAISVADWEQLVKDKLCGV